MYLSKIFLLNSYFSRFHFHYEIEVSLSEGSGVLELSLDSVNEPEKRNVFKYEFAEPGSKIIKDKIPLTGLVEGEFIFALCLFDNSLKRVLAACSYPLELILERDSMMDYLFDYELVNLSISENKGLICKALVKNLGLESWDENSLPVNVSLNLISNDQISHEIISLNSINLLSGAVDELRFSNSDLNLERGIYSISILSNIAGASTTNNSNLDTPKIYLSGRKNVDKAKIEIQESKIKLNKYIALKGKVSNIGATDWYLGPDVKNPFLLGFKLFSLEESGEKYIGEFRYNPEKYWCKSGESFEFYLAHELKIPLSSNLRVDIDIVREGSYWLFEFTDSKVEVILEPSTTNDAENISDNDSIRSGLYVQNKSEVKNILVIAPSLPLFDRESGGLRMFEIVKQLVGEGKQVSYFYESVGISSDPTFYLNTLKELNISTTNDIKSVLLSFKSPPDLVILSIWECAERYIKDVRATFPNALMIADSVDLHWERERRAIEAGLSIQSMIDWQKRKEREKAVYELADVVWLVTDEDRNALIEECPLMRTMIVSNIHELREVVLNEKSFEHPRGLFIGHFRHEPNVSAGLEAIRVVKEYNKTHTKKISLYVVGDNAPEEIRELHDGSEILVMGHVSDIQALERRSSFLLAPLKYGAGIKGKICESISAGLPIITSDIGNEGLKLVHKEEAYIANDFQSSIEGIEFILSDPNRALSMVNKSRVKLNKYFSRSAVKPILKNLVDFTPITIAIVTYNQRDLLESCLSSIFNLTSYPNFKVFVYSNGCTDGTLDLISEYDRGYRGKFSYYRSNENDYFVRPNNKIITSCVPDDVVLLNNDTQIIDPNWLHELNFSAYSALWIGASGCMVLDLDGKISEAGAKMNEDGIGANLGRGDSPDNPAHNQVKYVDYVSGCCLYMKRSSIDLIGALDEDFHPMYYEDTAWQFKLRNQGYKTVYTPRTRIIHKEGSSAGTDLNTGMKKFQVINREKFKKKFSSK